MSNKSRKKLLKKGILIQNEVTNRILPQTINQIILLSSSFVVILTTLTKRPILDNSLYQILLGFLLLSIFCGVICISILTVDYYILGKRIQNKAKVKVKLDKQQIEFHTGKIYYYTILWSFIFCLVSFLASLVLLVIYAGEFKI